jgi:hypothetical protein
VSTGQNPLATSVASKGKVDTAFNKATNASQALNVIVKQETRFNLSWLNGYGGL